MTIYIMYLFIPKLQQYLLLSSSDKMITVIEGQFNVIGTWFVFQL